MNPTKHEPGRKVRSSDIPIATELLTLTPEFLQALRKVAPKKRRMKVRYVFIVGVLGVLLTLGLDVGVREWVLSQIH
jgi:hypothetical protein